MAEPVRCDVCGGLFSSSHLSSHKRLSHGGKTTGHIPKSHINDQDAMRRIVDLFDGLAEESKKNVLDRLTAPRGTP